jgi:hypothetical protein
MNLEALTTAGTLAITTAVTFLVSARLWQVLTHFAAGGPVFPESTMREAAQRFRDEAERLRSNYASYLAAALISCIMFVAALGLDLRGFYQGYPTWQLSLVAILLGAMALFVLYKIVTTLRKLASARFRRDASIAVGHQLLGLAATHGAVFHDVEIGKTVVDHVFVGHNGAYAIHVIACRNRGKGPARLDGEQLCLGEQVISLDTYTNRVHKLSASFSNLAGQKVRVRSVVAIPGWDIEGQQGEKHLLVNERTLPMLTGWKSQSDYLMNEDVDAIRKFLVERGRRG